MHLPRALDRALPKAIAQGHCWSEGTVLGRASSMPEIAKREGLTERFIEQQIALAFLPPNLAEAVLAADAGPTLSVRVLATIERPLAWKDYSTRPA